MPNIKVEPTIPNYPPQGIQAQLDLLYLWNPDVANDLIEQLNKALEEVAADLSAYLTKAEAAATYATQTEVTQLSGTVEEVSNKVDTVDSDLKELGGQTASIQQDVNTLKTGKQDTLNASQLSAINSGITSAKVTAYDAYAEEISTAQSTADKADGAAEVAQQTANLAGQEAAQALTQLAGKVNINQGADNAGKVMTVGEDGNLAPADAPSSSLPDQTGNAGKFLTTDGTNASWGGDNILMNSLPTSLGINTNDTNVFIGNIPSEAGADDAGVFVGYSSYASYRGGRTCSTAVGSYSRAGSKCSIVIGYDAKVDVSCPYAIQLGPGLNSLANTFSVGLSDTNNYTLLQADGIIPTERLATGGTTGQVLKKTDTGCEWGDLDVYSKEETDQQIQNAIGTIETALAEV